MKRRIKIYLIISLSFIFCSCNIVRQKILYTYNGVTVTRIDMDNDETFFYYGDHTKEKNYGEPNMKIFWGQRDGGFGVYFIFNEDKSVEVVTLLGRVEVVKKNPNFYLTVKLDESNKNYDVYAWFKWYHGIQWKYNNIVYVEAPPIEDEIERNVDNKSKVIAKY